MNLSPDSTEQLRQVIVKDGISLPPMQNICDPLPENDLSIQSQIQYVSSLPNYKKSEHFSYYRNLSTKIADDQAPLSPRNRIIYYSSEMSNSKLLAKEITLLLPSDDDSVPPSQASSSQRKRRVGDQGNYVDLEHIDSSLSLSMRHLDSGVILTDYQQFELPQHKPVMLYHLPVQGYRAGNFHHEWL